MRIEEYPAFGIGLRAKHDIVISNAARVPLAVPEILVHRRVAVGSTFAKLLRNGFLTPFANIRPQLQCVRAALDAAGLHDVPVGTVDKFQGQEAAVAIMSLAASSAAEVPRGIEFLLMRNRLNVAISRAKLAAYLLYSPALLDDLPRTPLGVAQLSAFARLVGDDDGRGGA